MAGIRKPRVNTNPIANAYAPDQERIVEFSFQNEGGGGLISLRPWQDGTSGVHLYRLDPNVKVTVEGKALVDDPDPVREVARAIVAEFDRGGRSDHERIAERLRRVLDA